MENMEINNVLVTGSEGYIGSVLVDKLVEKNYTVTGLDTWYFKEISLGNRNRKYQTLQYDVRDVSTIPLERIDAIIHLAALSNDPMGEIDAALTYDINYKATVELAEKAKKAGVKKFIFSSSCSVYGTAENGIVDETSTPNPLTHYAHSKINAENDLMKLSNDFFQVYLLRNATVYGYAPVFRDDLVVNNLTACAYTLGSLQILSDGTPWRPLIDVRDLSDIFITFLETEKKIYGQPINIGFQENNVQVKDIVEKIHTILPDAQIQFTNERPNDKRSYKVSFDKFSSYFPEIHMHWTIESAIKDLLTKFEEYTFTKNMFENGFYTRLHHLKKLMNNKKINNMLYWNS